MDDLANKGRKWYRMCSSTWNVACERTCRMRKIRREYAVVHGMWRVKELVE